MGIGRITTVLPPLSQAVGYGVVIGIGLLFAVGMIGVTRALKKYLHEDPAKGETFMVADRTVGVGLTASAVISSWAWTTAMLSSATVTYNFGVAGAFWFASGCIVQIAFFAFLAIQAKIKVPRAHTLLEIIRTRYGKTAHILYMFFSISNNIISVANMLLGASAVVSALTDIPVTAANFLLPLGVVLYTLAGGLKATFLTDYIHTTIILILIIYFSFLTFSTDLIRSPAHLWDLVNEVSRKTPVAQNEGGSYFTMKSLGALEFGIIHILGNFGLVIADTSFWQKGFAADTAAAVPGYILGGVAYFCIPFSLGTIMGLAGVALQSNPKFPTYPAALSEADINNGLILPFVAMTLGGTGAAGAVLTVVFMAVTSTTSSQLIAVSSISAYDVYKTWINPRATDGAVVAVSHWACVGFGIFMSAFSTALFYGGASLGWTIYMIGVIVCPSMFPILLTLLWRRQTRTAAIVAPITGMISGIIVWLTTAYHYGDGVISVATTGASLPCVFGTITSAFLPLPVSVILSLVHKPTRYDWAELNTNLQSVRAPKIDEESAPTPHSWLPEELSFMHRSAHLAGWFALFNFIAIVILFPFPLYGSGYIFSSQFFDGWIRVGQIWTWFALGVAGLLPLVQGRKAIWIVVSGVLGFGGKDKETERASPASTRVGSISEEPKEKSVAKKALV